MSNGTMNGEKFSKLRYGDLVGDKLDKKTVRFGRPTGMGYCTVMDLTTGEVLPDERREG